ncbi:MAG: hypothetical protein ACM33B_15650 [Pseudomonadota bacterium]
MADVSSEIVVEGERLTRLAAAADVPLRLIGGVAARIRAREPVPDALARAYGDLDFVTARGRSGDVGRLFREAGYEADTPFNALHGKRRLIFYGDRGDKIDVFVGEFAMCHRVPVDDRLLLEPVTLPLAELLLTKLQIVELNEKDVRDALTLLHGHEVADRDGDALNAARVAELCASDWGLWRTITHNIVECRDRVAEYDLSTRDQADIVRRFDTLLDRIEQEPKSRGWRLRARVGERVRWYELPEEPGEGV